MNLSDLTNALIKTSRRLVLQPLMVLGQLMWCLVAESQTCRTHICLVSSLACACVCARTPPRAGMSKLRQPHQSLDATMFEF